MNPWIMPDCKGRKHHWWVEVLNRDMQQRGKACLACGLYNSIHGVSHLDVESPLFAGKPHMWIQWKGTNVCCDVYCDCGAHLHFDCDFLYFFKCRECGQVWESGTHVNMYKVTDHRADGSFIKESEDHS